MSVRTTKPITGDVGADDDVLCRLGDPEGVLLNQDTIDAICTAIERVHYARYDRHEFVFSFRVLEPPNEGLMLKMYVRYLTRWRYLPRTSKLLSCVRVALQGQRRPPGAAIRKSWFVGRVFRVRLRNTAGPAPYTVVDSLLERLA